MAFDTRERAALALAEDFLTGQDWTAPGDALSAIDADGATPETLAAEMVVAGWHTLEDAEAREAVELEAGELAAAVTEVLARWRAAGAEG